MDVGGSYAVGEFGDGFDKKSVVGRGEGSCEGGFGGIGDYGPPWENAVLYERVHGGEKCNIVTQRNYL